MVKSQDGPTGRIIMGCRGGATQTGASAVTAATYCPFNWQVRSFTGRSGVCWRRGSHGRRLHRNLLKSCAGVLATASHLFLTARLVLMAFQRHAQHFGGYVMQRPQIGYISGVPLDQNTCDTWDDIWKFQAHPEDVLVAAYPKAGITWMQEIVDMICQEGDAEKCRRAPTYDRHPFLEAVAPKPVPSGLQLAENMKPPRILKTHLPVQLLPPSFWVQDCKVIYVARNAKDSMVSYYHFQRMNRGLPDPGDWGTYFSTFLAGEVIWGSWFDHVLGWWEAKDQHQVLYIFYEDMMENTRREIEKVRRFLGKELSEQVLEDVYHHTTFQAMRENTMANYSSIPSFVMDHSVSPFMRKVTSRAVLTILLPEPEALWRFCCWVMNGNKPLFPGTAEC